MQLDLWSRQRAGRGARVAVVRQRDAGLEQHAATAGEHRAVGEAGPVGGVADGWRPLRRGQGRPRQAEAGHGEVRRAPSPPGGMHYFTLTTWRIMPSVLVST